jgi:hypothetical protein
MKLSERLLVDALAVSVFALALLWVCFAFADPLNSSRDRSDAFYDRNGSFAGSTITHGNSTSAYDQAGRYDGQAIRNSDGTTSFYDHSGHFVGSRSSTTQPR